MPAKGERTREKVMNEAARLFHQQGFGATSINDIIAATGLKKGSLYFHFQGKDDLALAILERSRVDFIAFLDVLLDGSSPGEALRNFFQGVLKKNLDSGLVGGCIFGNTALEMGDKDPRYTDLIRKVFLEWVDKLEGVIREAQSTGEVRNDLSAQLLARQVVSMIEGCIMFAKVDKDKGSFRNCLKGLEIMIGLSE